MSSNNVYTHLYDLPESLNFLNALKKPPDSKNEEQTKSDLFYSAVSKSSGSPATKNYTEIK